MSMIIQYYKGYVEIEKLREMSKTSRQGTTGYHIVQTLKELGFESYGIKTKFDFLTKKIELPAIAHVIIDQTYKHYIVIYKVNKLKNQILIGDPSKGIRTISFDYFKSIWNNILILMYPVQNIVYEKNKNVYNYLKSYLFRNKKLIIDLFVLSISFIILSVICSFYFKIIIDNTSNQIKFLTLFILLNLFKIITDFFRNKILIYLNQKIDLTLTMDTYSNILSFPYSVFRNKTTGDIVSRISDLSKVKNVISKTLLTIFMDLPLTFISALFLFVINKKLFLFSIFLIFLLIILILLFRNSLKKYIDKTQIKHADVTSYMVETISGFETIKGINIEQKVKNKLKNKLVKTLYSSYKLDTIFNLQTFIKNIIYEIGILILLYFGILEVNKGNMTLGLLITYNTLLTLFLEPIKNFINLDLELKDSYNTLKRIFNLNNKENDDGIYNKLNGNITFNKLTYKQNEKVILKNLSLTIKKGNKILLMGQSGSGKSTLLKIIMKYYLIDRNMLKINNIDINDYTKKSIHNNITYISQNETLFTDTIYNNITIKQNKNFKDIVNICYIDEILKGNMNYNYLIEENGFNLSGGEKQRIVLARALMNNFNILIIDEGLSEIDIDLERKILKKLFNYFKNKTIIIVSHRKDNADLFDALITIQKGQAINSVRSKP